MPFDVWFTRRGTYGGVLDEQPREGDLTRERFFGAIADMADAMDLTIARRSDGSRWVRYPISTVSTGEPWFAASFRDMEGRGHGRVSFSFTSPWFLRDLANFLEIAPKLAARMEARIFEEQQGREITEGELDELLDPEGEWAQALGGFWEAGRRELNRRNHAPFELPSGAIDEASDYFVWRLVSPLALPDIDALLAGTPEALAIHRVGDGAVLEDRRREEGAVRIFPVDERCVQIWPYWSELPFARVAAEVLAALRRIEERVGGGEVCCNGQAVTPVQRAEIEAHARGLGVEFFEWWTEGLEPARFE